MCCTSNDVFLVVTTWDDEASETLRHDVSGSSKRNRDRWDDEYDEGKVKKIKKHRHSHSSGTYKDNPFQRFQNRRNFEVIIEIVSVILAPFGKVGLLCTSSLVLQKSIEFDYKSM